MKAALVISERDNVATALAPLESGQRLEVAGSSVTVIEAVPSGHKVALRAIGAGEPVTKYGSPIGVATVDIPAGAHVHTHNLASSRGRGDLASAAAEAPAMQGRLAEPPDRAAGGPGGYAPGAPAGPDRRAGSR